MCESMKGDGEMKLSISLNDVLVKMIDEYAEENFLSRSGAISKACNKLLKDYEFAIKKGVEQGKVFVDKED